MYVSYLMLLLLKEVSIIEGKGKVVSKFKIMVSGTLGYIEVVSIFTDK